MDDDIDESWLYETCKKCGKRYKILFEWCKLCQRSGNEQIDDFIQEKQSKASFNGVVFEWIPYSEFGNIKETGQSDFTKICLAIWKDGPLSYNKYHREYTRNQNGKVTLKNSYNSQNKINEFLNEVWNFFINLINSFLIQ